MISSQLVSEVLEMDFELVLVGGKTLRNLPTNAP